jgi:indolepyruvate decarboxylase
MTRTVIDYLLGRLKQLGIRDIFGVPGDYAFPINDAICNDRELRWIGCCNELNASYAADGYARINGISALCTTFGVGELSALCGLAGSYAEHNLIFHIVGMPNMVTQNKHAIVHHTLGDGKFNIFMNMATPVVCAKAMLTPENCIPETERVIAAAFENHRPVYIAIPGDHVNEPVVPAHTPPIIPAKSDPKALEEAVSAIVDKLSNAKTACIIPGIFVDRYGFGNLTTEVVNASGLPYVTMPMDKSVLDETNPSYLGLYNGQLIYPEISEFVESCDCILAIGTIPSDFNTGGFTARLDRSRMINILLNDTHIGYADYINVKMADVLLELARRLPFRKDVKGPKVKPPAAPKVSPEDPITADYLYPRLASILKPNDIIMSETGTATFGLLPLFLPKGASFHNQTLWGSIGWATPASFGAALAGPGRRVILVTGEGSHQMTAQEISQFHRYGLKPIIFVINNNGYLIERMLSKRSDYYYNDLVKWEYHKLPEGLGCAGWMTEKASTCGQLEDILGKLGNIKTGAYIEITTPEMSAPPLMKAMHDNLQSLYSEK